MVKAGLQSQALADDGDQHVDRDGDPDLGLHGILASAKERLDSEMLLDPFEQLNDILPINNALLMPRSTTRSIPCLHTVCQ